ncbi:unnamed protein product [Rhodiola kirilowii]
MADTAAVARWSNNHDELRHSSLTVDTHLSLPELKPHIIKLCKDLFKEWISGGITNLLLKRIAGHKVPLGCRIWGEAVGVFRNGMVQSFINARTLNHPDMRVPKLAAGIAKQLKRFHQVEIPGSREPQLWNDMLKFFNKASSLSFNESEKQKKYEAISFNELQNEINELQELTSHFKAPVVFSHNDLLCGNIMVNDDEGKVYLIDFEYGSYNYRGFDIGNHFNEYAGYECDYSLYPTKEEQDHFLSIT